MNPSALYAVFVVLSNAITHKLNSFPIYRRNRDHELLPVRILSRMGLSCRRSPCCAEGARAAAEPPVTAESRESDWASGDLKDVYSWVEGEYHQAHHYTMVMYLNISYEPTSEPLVIDFLFSDGSEIYGDGTASYVGGDDMPRFEGVLNSSWEPISIEYDGYNFIVNCSALDFEDASFFLD